MARTSIHRYHADRIRAPAHSVAATPMYRELLLVADRPINLNKARKARDRLKKRAQADENAVMFGRTKAQRRVEAADREKARKALEDHRREE